MARPPIARIAQSRLSALWLLALGVPLLTLCQALAPAIEIDAGSPGDQRALHGFHAPIPGERVTYRWTAPEAELRLHGWSRRSARLQLRLDGGAGAADRRLTILQVDSGREMATLIVSSGWRDYVVDLPQPAFGLAAALGPPRLALRAERYRPGPSGEEFGFKLDSIRVQPVGSAWLIGVGRAVLLAWPLALACLALQGLAGRTRGRRPLLTGVAMLLPFLALATLAIGLARFPLWAAWLFPPAPAIAGTLTLLVTWGPLSRATITAATQLQKRASTPLRQATLLAALLALGMLYARAPLTWALPLACLAVPLALLLNMPTGLASADNGADDASAAPSRRDLVLLAVLIVLISFGLRFYRLTDLPSGLWRDEARHGLAALRVIEDPGYRPVFVPAADVPAGGVYAFVPSFLLFGIRVWTMRAVTALAGALTVVPLALVARRLTRRWDTALIAAALLAGSSWHLTISRLSFMSVFQPLLELSALAVFGHALDAARSRRSSGLWLLFGGALLGLTLYTYHTGRLALPIGVGFLLCLAAQDGHLRRGLTALAPALAALVFVAAPLWWYAAQQPKEASARMGQVFLFTHASRAAEAPLAALDASLARHLLMLHVRGDAIGRHNLPGQPQLDPLLGFGFLVGLLWLSRRPCSALSLFLLGACALGVLPSLLSVDGPRATRAFELLPYSCIVGALGWTLLLRRGTSNERRPLLPLGILTLATAALAGWSYFVAAPRDPAVWRSFYAVETRVGQYIRALAAQEGAIDLPATYLPAAVARQEVTQYLTHGLRFGIVDEQDWTLHPRPTGPFRLLLTDPVSLHAVESSAALGRRRRQTTAGPLLPDGRTPAFWVLAFD